MRFPQFSTGVAVIVCLALAGVARAGSTYWQVGTGNWSTGSNWDNGEPDANDLAYISNGGTGQITQAGEICAGLYLGEGSGQSGTVELSGGSLSVPSLGWEYIGYDGTGTFSQSGGANDAHGLLIAYGFGSTGAYELGGNGSLSTAEEEYIGYGGTGTFTQTGGVHTAAAGLSVGQTSGSDGTYELSGGTLSVPGGFRWETVGDQGTGTFVHSGGTNNTPGGLHVGSAAGGIGSYELSGTGNLTADNECLGFNGTGTFTQTGGTNTITIDLYMGYNSGASGVYAISDGNLSTGSLYVGNNGAGTLDISGVDAEIIVSNLLSFGVNSTVTAVAGATIHMTGADFENLSTNEEDLAGLGNLELIFEGGPEETDDLEVACEDKGAVTQGYYNNFALGKLTVGGADVGMVRLVDNTDNGNRGGAGGDAEALYVDSLTLNAGSVLDLNNLHLYWRTEFIDNGGTILNGDIIQVHAETIYVDDDAPYDPGPGDPTVSDPDEDGSPEHPFDAIQEGINAASDGIQVIALDGTYTGLGNKNLDFGGKPITVRTENGPENCIIDCEDDGRGFYFHSGETATSVVDGFTIMNGSTDDGGGIYCYSSSPTIINCRITDNTASGWGGGVYCFDSSPTIANCTITANETGYSGGGVSCFSHTDAPITNCLITDNTAGEDGGGIYCSSYCDVTITNCTITRNIANGEYGGGVCTVVMCYVVIANSVLWQNAPQEIYALGWPDPTVTYSDVQGGWVGTGNINADPLFIDPDGPDDDPNTWEDNNFRLAAGSPCVDAADNTAVPPDVADLDDDQNTGERTPLDLDGSPRFVDDPNTADTGVPDPPDYVEVVDMGAYEFWMCQSPADCDDDDECTEDICDPDDPEADPHGCMSEYHARVYADVYPLPYGDGAVEGFDILCILDAANDLDTYGCMTVLPSGYMAGDIYPCDSPDGAVEGFDILAVLDAANDIKWCDDPCP